MNFCKEFIASCLLFILMVLPIKLLAKSEIPLGDAYHGAKCVAAVGDFAVQVPGAPQAVGDGLREMLQTALFESNYFTVVDRMDSTGISAELLLSDSFMADPDALLQQEQMLPAEVLIYATLVFLEGGGAGVRVKIPWMPLSLGGAYYKAKATVELRAVDSSTGRVIAVSTINSTAESGKGSLGTTLFGIAMPVELEMFKNTPLELCIRDTIYRGVISLCKQIPTKFFRDTQ